MRFIGDALEADESTSLADDIEQIAVFARRGVRPFASFALAGFRPLEPYEHRSSGRVAGGCLRTKPNALQIEFEAGVDCIAIEHLNAERMQRREEGQIRLLAKRMA
jgi:hypothetical protein